MIDKSLISQVCKLFQDSADAIDPNHNSAELALRLDASDCSTTKLRGDNRQ